MAKSDIHSLIIAPKRSHIKVKVKAKAEVLFDALIIPVPELVVMLNWLIYIFFATFLMLQHHDF